MNKYQEFIHNSKHASMGCGPMGTCELCRHAALGDVAATTPDPVVTAEPAVDAAFSFTTADVLRIAAVATISTIFAETFIKPFLVPTIKSFLGEPKANPSHDHYVQEARAILEHKYGKPAYRFTDKQRKELSKLASKAANERLSFRIYPEGYSN